MTDEQKEIVRQLGQPHRVPNVFALFKTCEKAAELIQQLIEKNEAAKAKPARRSKK